MNNVKCVLGISDDVIIGISSVGAITMIIISIMIAVLIRKKGCNTREQRQKSNQGIHYHISTFCQRIGIFNLAIYNQIRCLMTIMINF